MPKCLNWGPDSVALTTNCCGVACWLGAARLDALRPSNLPTVSDAAKREDQDERKTKDGGERSRHDTSAGCKKKSLFETCRRPCLVGYSIVIVFSAQGFGLLHTVGPVQTWFLVLAYDGTDFAGWQRQAEAEALSVGRTRDLGRCVFGPRNEENNWDITFQCGYI